MARSKKRGFLIFSWWMSALLIVSTIVPPTALAQTASEVNTSFSEESTAAGNKVSKKLKNQFRQKKTVTFLIKFKEQADTEKAAEKALKKAKKQKQTAAEMKRRKRSAVVSALRSTAIEAQHRTKNIVKEEKKDGRVQEMRSFFIVNAMAVTGTEEVMNQLASLPEVDKVLPNETRKLIGAEKQKAGKKTNETPNPSSIEWNIEQIGAPQVWNTGIDGSGTVVANIDTGVQWDHPALKKQYRGYRPERPDRPDHEYSWFDATEGQTEPYDDLGHGTHTMGTMVGAEPDGSNPVGVAPGAEWIAVKAFTAAGGTDADLLAAGEWILAPTDADGNPHPEKAPDVVNNSWGGGPGLNEWYRPMVQNWRAADIFPEFSAGNSGDDAETIAAPSNYPESFATGATDIDQKLASFSSRGPSPYDEIKPEITAPGVNIRSSVPGSQYEGGWNGTSMAGPHISGVIALLRQADSSLTVDELEQILLTTAVPRTDSKFPDSPNNGYGYGRVNAYDAVASIREGIGKVRGQVMKEGEDEEKPTYRHQTPAEAFQEMQLPLTIDVRDNVSVTRVVLEYRSGDHGDWKRLNASRTSGDYREGTYQATIPADDVQKPNIAYRWKIVDYGDNPVTSEAYEIPVQSGITRGYSQDFESIPIGWISYGFHNSWEWGTPASGPDEAVSGEKVYATNLEGDYENGANMTLLLPPVNLPEGETYLQFKQWYELETDYDYGQVLVSTDQEDWDPLEEFNGSSNGWIDGQANLSEYAGQRVYLAFQVQSDNSITKKGWYLDDLYLRETPLDSPNPTKPGKEKNRDTPDKKKKPVDPSKLKPTGMKKMQSPAASPGDKPSVQPSALPLGAEVSVLESGRSVTTDPADGGYSMSHAAGTFTLRAEAYGYRSADQQVQIPRDGTADANFILEPIPRGTVSGTIMDQETGKPVEGATVTLMEDAAVAPVKTDENGQYSITAYEGTYTLHVSAPQYYAQEDTVTVKGEKTTEKDIKLKPFIGYPGEIGYDDGTAENARAFHNAGDGWAVKMSLEEGQERAMITSGVFRFWDTEWPTPGGTDFQVAVYDASGEDGAPGRKIAGPFDATAQRNGEWTVVDLSDRGILVDDDFYMVYIQTDPYPDSPGLATDENGENAGRSWQWVDGSWAPSPQDEGNYMIRARVDYEVTSPSITSPKDGTYTNDPSITVEGEAAPTTRVTIQNNGEETASTPARDDGSFTVEVPLNKGENALTATASTENGSTEPSETVKVFLDRDQPDLSIDEPRDTWKTNREAITVRGKATDEHLEEVRVNGKKADVEKDGSYTRRILLDEGKNPVTVTAADKAGNRTTRQIVVYAKFHAPEVSELKPEEDIHLKSGESVRIELDSEPGLDASFIIRLPQGHFPSNFTEIPLQETEEGHYAGFYTATSNLKDIKGAEIEIILKDEYGNETRQTADGQLYINAD
ncbi:S8 family peptidase [Paludifilum halophilum]|uniref:Peptidase S8 n=1 Tax=Paludifilum halophilum TaxID=1642702 RepID=A0A235BB06_9BACL|nr:S8 family peptidase [Paludifilum halophilum]OYD09456.1 peptidase S8 [Paludifilum halophilum]